MSDKDTGGSAFPSWDDNHYTEQRPRGGMTLRDYFAAKAMKGEIAAQSEEYGVWRDVDKLALRAYQIADAMIQARKA